MEMRTDRLVYNERGIKNARYFGNKILCYCVALGLQA